MAGFFATPPTLHGTHLSTVPRELYADATSDWAPDASIVHLNPPLIALPLSPQHCLLTTGNGPTPPIFLEGITTDTQGIIFVVDIPYGRILRLDLAVFSPPSCCTTPHDPPSSAPHPGQPLTSSGWSIATTFKGNPNGLALTGEGRIAIADYAEGILVYDPATGTVNPHLTRRNLERFKGPNDLIVASNGDLYQGQTDMADPTGRVYRLSETGKLDMLIGNGPSPNGLVLSPDETILYIAMTRDNSVWRCPLHKDGTTTKVGRFFATNGSTGPDGLTVDAEGNLFICMPPLGSIFVISPHGEPVARIQATPAGQAAMVTNCIFGSTPADRKRLYFCDSFVGSVGYVDWHCEGGTPLRASKKRQEGAGKEEHEQRFAKITR